MKTLFYDLSLLFAGFLTPNIVRWLATHLTSSAGQRWLWNVIDHSPSPEQLWAIQAEALTLDPEAVNGSVLLSCLYGVDEHYPNTLHLPSAIATYYHYTYA